MKVGIPSRSRHEYDLMFPERMLKQLVKGAGSSVLRWADWIVVLSDELASLAWILPNGGPRKAFICNGDFMLLFMDQSFYSDRAWIKTAMSSIAAARIRRHSRDVSKYDLLLANSEFTRNFMSYIYGTHFQGVCYPPVDLDLFKPRGPKTEPRFALSVMRNNREQGLGVLEQLADKVPVKIIGGARVRGAEAVGRVSDQELAELYSQATIVVAPVISEFFGYIVAESMAAGTPVIARNICGPGELVRNLENGWLARDSQDLIRLASGYVRSGYRSDISLRLVESAQRFGQDVIAKELLTRLEDEGTKSAILGDPNPLSAR
ncbi:MAG: glycosyltransferase family 4 protein [Nitrososphaerota archaeon]|nr:glycosyltransferase family 4 protein [Nitrososphaerota archaeon]